MRSFTSRDEGAARTHSGQLTGEDDVSCRPFFAIYEEPFDFEGNGE
jgi:hypothetical protein